MMEQRPFLSPRLTGLCGLAAPMVAFGCIFLAIAYAPWFTWTGSWLSDLGGTPGQGTPVAGGITASFLFNNGLMLAALLGLGLAGGLWGQPGLDTTWGRRGLALLALDMVALFGVGFYPSSVGRMHYYASVTFFVLIPLSLLSLARGLKQAGAVVDGARLQLLGAAALVTVPLIELAPRPYGHNAVSELLPALILGAASAGAGHWLFYQGSLSKEKGPTDKANET